MKILNYITSLLLLLFSTHSEANTSPDFITIVCESCYTQSDYRRAAASMDEGTVVVINTKKYKAEAFYIIYEPMLGGSNPVPTSLPSGVEEALQMYEDLVSAMNDFQYEHDQTNNSQSFNPLKQFNSKNFDTAMNSASCSANGCGTGWNLYLVPDFPFTEACNIHDTCYCSDSSKSACDRAFLERMNNRIEDLIASNAYIKFNKLLQYLVKIHLKARAAAYYLAVDEARGAKDAYCDSTTNASAGECNPDLEANGQGAIFTSVNRVFEASGETDGILSLIHI